MIYQLVILFHIIGVIMFFGNLMIAFFLLLNTYKHTPPQIMLNNLKLVNMADKWLTTISVILILATGVAAALIADISIFGTGWIIWSLILFGISGLLFLMRVLPLQIRMEKSAKKMIIEQSVDITQLSKDLKTWKFWATLASSAALISMALMIVKPAI